jgi:tetratricopeptide (TPR) repeat protein
VVNDRIQCLKTLVSVSVEVHDERRTAAAIDRLANAGCNEDRECASNLAWAANAEEGRGNQQRALGLYRRAHVRSPEQDEPLESIARLAGSLRLHAEAAEAYAELARRHPRDPGWISRADEEHAAAVRAALTL